MLQQASVSTLASAHSLVKVTETTDRTAELERENRALASANRDLEYFVYAISHDLRAPLRTMSGFAQLLADDLQQPLTREAARDLNGIFTGIDRMQSLLARWLQLARRDYAELQSECVNLSVAAQHICQELAIADPSRSITAEIQPDVVTHGDPVLIRELLQNLLSNAWKFTARNADVAQLEFGARMEGGQTHFFVRDNGAGFDPARADELFRPFHRLHAAQGFGGTGVGLAISQRIVERHRGHIWAEGQPGHGATFWFTLGETAMHDNPIHARCDSQQVLGTRELDRNDGVIHP